MSLLFQDPDPHHDILLAKEKSFRWQVGEEPSTGSENEPTKQAAFCHAMGRPFLCEIMEAFHH
jgi:hypothetical protein